MSLFFYGVNELLLLVLLELELMELELRLDELELKLLLEERP
jgi:hypothetical protein